MKRTSGTLKILDLNNNKQPRTISGLLQPMSGTSRAVSSTPRIIKMATMKMSQIKKFLPSFIITDSYSFGFGVVVWWIKCG